MQVLHAHWLPPLQPGAEAGMIFWSERAKTPPPKVKATSKSAQKHPFADTGSAVKSLLQKLIDRKLDAKYRSLTLWLPTGEFAPQPSPQLVHDWEVDGGPFSLAQWTMRGVWLPAVEAFEVLMALSNRDEYPPTVRVADECYYWQVVSRMVLEALAQQKIRPGLEEIAIGQKYEARWHPVLDGPKDGPRLAQLKQAMPPICRADAPDPAQTLPVGAVLDSYLNIMTDALARQWGAPKQPSLAPGQQTVGDNWVRALFDFSNRQPTIQGPVAAIHHAQSSYRAWLRNLYVAGPKEYRVTFQLEAPVGFTGEWELFFLLQARDDPSLLVPAKEVWKTRRNTLNMLNRYFKQPQETMLTALGYSARFFQPVQRALETAKPKSVTLNPEEAHQFLRECAPLLEQSGFGVLVPPWWNKPGARLGVRLKMSSSSTSPADVSSGIVGFENLVKYRWEVSIGDMTLTREEFDALVNLKSPLVQVRGQWVQLDPEQIEAAIRFWDKQAQEAEIGLLEALQLGLGAAQEAQGLPVEGVELDGWLGDWIDQLNDSEKLEILPSPQGLDATLRPYQEYGYSWLSFMHKWGMGALLADSMGLGKCLKHDSLVFVNGMLHTAEAIWESFAAETTFDGEGVWAAPTEQLLVNAIDEATGRIVLSPIRRLYRQSVQERLREIELEDGSKITITYRHKLLTNQGWSNNLQVGDYVCVPAKLVWHGQPVDPDLVKFVAWQIAEGAPTPSPSPNTRGGERRMLPSPSIGGGAGGGGRPRKGYRELLESKGYCWGELSATKTIPPFIMQGDLDAARIFLRHYFDAEASVVERMRSIEVSSASYLLIQQVSVLLRRFGIWLRITKKRKRATNGSGIYREYYIGTLGGNAARLFLQEIGFGYAEKQQKLEAICARKCNTNVEGIPASEIVAEAVASTKLPIRHFGMHNTVYLNGSQQFSHASLGRVVTHMDRILSGHAEQAYRQLKPSKWTARTLAAYANLDQQQLSETRQSLQHLLDQEVFYCKIKAIEEVAYDGWVYDFEVAQHHNFVANQILCHNTIQTLTMLLRDKEQEVSTGPVLLICPTSVVTNWEKEAKRFTPDLTTVVHQGPKRLRGKKFIKQAEEVDMVLTSYALARRDEKALAKVNWYGVILDEAQNIKNSQTKQAQVIRRLPASFRLALTGTPIENRLSELWSIMQFLNPGYLGSRKNFRDTFILPIEKEHDQVATDRLRRLTEPFILRRLKTDPTVIQDLPEKLETKVYCHLTKEQATLYEAVVKDALVQVEESEGIQRQGLVLSMLMKLKQICNHPGQFLHQFDNYKPTTTDKRSGKLMRLTQMLEEIVSQGDRVLIFTQFAKMGGVLKSYLQTQLGVGTQFLHGGVPGHKRETLVKRFQEDADGPPIFILSIKAGGTGLNLTRANHVFHFDRWWNPAVEDQATDRAFRIGQKKNVLVHKFVCVGTVEEQIDQMIESKKALAESIVGQKEEWLTEMSTDQLRELVTLRREIMA